MTSAEDEGLAALPAAALTDAGGSDPAAAIGADGEVDGDDHVEMVESADDAVADDGVVVSPAAQAKSLRNAAPPPIPGSHLRTPGPDLLSRPGSVDASASIPALPDSARGARTAPAPAQALQAVVRGGLRRGLPAHAAVHARGSDAARGRVHLGCAAHRAGVGNPRHRVRLRPPRHRAGAARLQRDRTRSVAAAAASAPPTSPSGARCP